MRGWLAIVLHRTQIWYIQKCISIMICVPCIANLVRATDCSSEVLPSYHHHSPRVCVIIRTYWGHGAGSANQLQTLLTSLQHQTYTEWEALLVVMDSRPFNNLAKLVADVHDERIWIYAEWIQNEFAPKASGGWAPGYHGQLYNLTDEAIRACPPSTEWVMATNGDNLYAETFFERVMSAPPEADAVAFDYFSRYQRCTGPPCLRFERDHRQHACKPNKMQWCHTDLGANVFRMSRLLHEDRRLGSQSVASGGLGSEHYDGAFANSIRNDGWNIHHVSDACLYDHSPSPQRCAVEGGVWDDSRTAGPEIGGVCITASEAAERQKAAGNLLEVVEVSLQGLQNWTGFLDSAPSSVSSIRCMRLANAEAEHHALMAVFGEACAAEADMQDLEAFMAEGLTGEKMDEIARLRADINQLQDAPEPWHKALDFERRPPQPPARDGAALPLYREKLPLDMPVY